MLKFVPILLALLIPQLLFAKNEEGMSFVHLSPKEYKAAIDVLSTTSQHVDTILKTLRINVLKNGLNGTLLDIGAGPGILTRRLKNSFSRIVIVEPNKEMATLYEKDEFEKHFTSFQSFNSNEKFDLVLCSHVLYHMPPAEMGDFILKMLSYVKKNGKLFIALMAPRGENHLLHSRFNPNYINSSNIKNILDKLKLRYLTYSDTNRFIAKTKFEFLSLVKFFVWEDCISKEQRATLKSEELKKIENSIQAIVDSSEAPYELRQEEDYFVVDSN